MITRVQCYRRAAAGHSPRAVACARGGARQDAAVGSDHVAARPDRRARHRPHRRADSGTPGVALQPVQFFVDGTLLSTVSDGPPYAAEWVDENPFDPREITVTVTDTLGNTAHDAVRLKPLEVFDESQVTSVLVDATVQDKAGRFMRI